MATEAATAGAGGSLMAAERQAFAPSTMTGLRKAAILMIAVGDDLAKVLFRSLSQIDVQQMTDEIANLGAVSQEQLTQVLMEFYGLLETEQYVVRGGPEYASRLLTEAFGPARAAELLFQVQKMRERTSGDLSMLQKMDPQQLSKFLENEHPQTVALALAHLDAKRGSAMLMHLDAELRVETVRRLAEMRQFSPEMAQKVGLILHRRMAAIGSNGRRSYAGFKAVADLLNRLDQGDSKDILEQIEQSDPKVATGIRTLMFTFDDLLTMPVNSVRQLVAAVDKKVLALALRGAKDNLKAFLFQAMSSRAVEMMKEDMEALGVLRAKDISGAQRDMLALATTMEAEGKIVLKLEGDEQVGI
jgi:flagellar motor switch protein FliG